MRPDDIPGAVALCRASRWNQTDREWQLFLTIAPKGAMVADLEGTVVGTAVTVPYEPGVAWIAMVLVDPARRGGGIGRALLRAAIDHAPAGSTAALDATPAGRGLYLSLGFGDVWTMTRYRARRDRFEPAVAGSAAGGVVEAASPRDLEDLVAVDRRAFGADRRAVIEWYWRQAPDRAWVSRDALDASGAGAVTGFALARPGHDADHVGPIVACSTAEAIALASTAISHAAAPAVIVDVPDRHAGLREWLTSRGFAVERPLTRMRRGSGVAGLPEHLFAIAGPELG